MSRLTPIDTEAAWKLAQRQVEIGVKAGHIDRREAREILEGARVSYRNQNYNRTIERIKERGAKR